MKKFLVIFSCLFLLIYLSACKQKTEDDLLYGKWKNTVLYDDEMYDQGKLINDEPLYCGIVNYIITRELELRENKTFNLSIVQEVKSVQLEEGTGLLEEDIKNQINNSMEVLGNWFVKGNKLTLNIITETETVVQKVSYFCDGKSLSIKSDDNKSLNAVFTRIKDE